MVAGDPANPPAILVHGWTSYKGVWEDTLPLLAEQYYVVALDLLGHGESDKPHNGDYSILAQGRRVLALADMLGLTHFTLVGHSMGGQTALAIAGTLAPERVTKLVVVSPVVSGQLTPGARYTKNLIGVLRYIHFTAPLVKPLRRYYPVAWFLHGRYWFADMRSISLEVWQRQNKHIMDKDGLTPYWKAGRAILNDDRTPDLPKITAPTLVYFGTVDNSVPFSEGDVLRKHLTTETRYETYEGCGHFPMFERRDAYQRALTGLPLLSSTYSPV